MGFVVRMSDKIQRIANLISHEPNVQEEKIIDTLRDFGTHSKLFKIYGFEGGLTSSGAA